MSTTRLHGPRRLLLALLALSFVAAPPPGDIGCADQAPADLDPTKFFDDKQEIDCQRCCDCHLATNACAAACGANGCAGGDVKPLGGSFPQGCYPLVQDGEVCLRALGAASCSDYADYVADQGATVPTECDFCPPRDAGAE